MSDPLAPFAGDHEGRILPINEGTYTVAWFAVCLCGWTGPDHPGRGAAAADLIGHRPQETP